MPETIETKDDVTRRNLLTAAQSLFQQYGLAKTTMEDIARAIGKAKSSLYYYYANKEEIFVAVVQKEKADVLASVSSIVAREKSATDKLKTFGLARVRALRKKKVLYKILANEIQHGMCMVQDLRQSYNETEHTIIREILEFGVANKEFRIKPEDIDVTAYIVNCALRGLEFDALMATKSPYKNALAVEEIAINLLLNALTA